MTEPNTENKAVPLTGSSSSSSSTAVPLEAEPTVVQASKNDMPPEIAAVMNELNLDLGQNDTKQINLGIKSVAIQKKSVEKVLFGTVCGFFAVNALMLPFLVPKARIFLGAPYLPTKRVVMDKMFNSIETHIGPLQGRKLVDLGSGDGRIILQASTQHAMRATGYELNPYLVLLSKFKCRNAPTANIEWQNLWNNPKVEQGIKEADVVTLYGRPGDKLMEKLAEFLEKTTKPECVVVSNVFHLPCWERRLIEDSDGLKVYDKRMQPHIPHEQFLRAQS